MSNIELVEYSAALLAVGSVLALLLSRNRRTSGWVSTAFVTAASVLLWNVVVRTFSMGPEPEVTLLDLPAMGASLTVRIDHLSAIFLAIVGTISFLTTLFSVEYMTRYEREGVAKYYPVLLIFFVGIVGVVTTSDFLFFLVFWELMTLTSFFLVIFETENAASSRAGLKYFITTHAATFCMVAAALVLWTKSGSFHFSAMRDALGDMIATRPVAGHLVVLLFFVGFATKAGVLPMGDWLPDAYPAAPSSATAAFGGSMTKLGIYGLLRVFMVFLPLSGATRIWGVVVALAGVVSLFVGTLTALRQDDAKRLMSFHVIGQVGYMLLGMGIGLYFLESNPALGMMGLMACVFHMINHSLYKSCLFLGAGTIFHRTGTRNLSALGGLGPVMPVTAACALGASLAIAGVPPLNGFSSKWLMYVTSIIGGRDFPVFIFLGVVAMFISLVTLASFLKYLGAAFLGPETTREGLREAPASMVAPQVLLALTCLVFGLVPVLPLRFVHQALVGMMPGSGLPDLESLLGGGQQLEAQVGMAGVGSWFPIVITAGLAMLALLAFGLQRAGAAKVRHVPVWTCGEMHESRIVRYPAGSFYLPFKHFFDKLYPTARLRAVRFPAVVARILEFDRWIYMPILRSFMGAVRISKKTHLGVPQFYLSWIVLGAILMVGIVMAVSQ